MATDEKTDHLAVAHRELDKRVGELRIEKSAGTVTVTVNVTPQGSPSAVASKVERHRVGV